MKSQNSILLQALLEQKHNEIAPEIPVDKYFQLFTTGLILRDYDLSYDEMNNGNVDGAGDGGIDGFYIFVNGILVDPYEDSTPHKGNIQIKVVLLQSKNTDSFNEEVINKLIAVTGDIFNLEKTIDSLKSVYNEPLLAHVQYFRDLYLTNIAKQPDLSVNYYYVAKSDEIHQNVDRKTANLKSVLESLFNSAHYEFNFITAEKLVSLNRIKRIESNVIKLKENPICTTDGGYICLSNLKDYYNFITDDNDVILKYLFDANVRDYQGETNVNGNIANTLADSCGSEFWWFNNGITILTDKASVSGKSVSLANPQIVNGCQTSYEIYKYFKDAKHDDDPRSLYIKIIVTSNDEIRSKVIRSTNSQTAIPPIVLRATDQIHRNIEDHLVQYNIYYDRRKNFWKNENKPAREIVTISTMAQCFISMILQEPNIARARPSTLLSNPDDYNKIFNISYNLEGYHLVYNLHQRIEQILSETTWLNRGDRLNIRYFVYLYFVLSARENKSKSIKNVQKYFQEFANINFDTINNAEIELSIKNVYDIYNQLGGSDKVAKGKAFTDKIIEVCVS